MTIIIVVAVLAALFLAFGLCRAAGRADAHTEAVMNRLAGEPDDRAAMVRDAVDPGTEYRVRELESGEDQVRRKGARP